MLNTIKKGDIYYIDKTVATGCEITTLAPARPAIIVSNDIGNELSGNVQVVYLTSSPKSDNDMHVMITDHTANLKMLSTAICEQITTVSKERVGNYIGKVTPTTLRKIEKGIMIALGIEIPETFEATTAADPQKDTEIDYLKKKLFEKDAELAKANKKADLFKGLADHLMNQIIEQN